MHKPFDLDAAKAGELIEHFSGLHWNTAHFVGVSLSGNVVVEARSPSGEWRRPEGVLSDQLRMAPKKVTVRYRVAILIATGSKLLYPEPVSNGAEAEDMSNRPDFIQWADSWKEIEVPQ